MVAPVRLAPRPQWYERKTSSGKTICTGTEIANSFSEQNSPLAQAEAFRRQAELRAAGNLEAQPEDRDFLRALEYGMPPAGGMGLGVDRLVMLLTDQPHLREVLLFPHLRPEAGGAADEELEAEA